MKTQQKFDVAEIATEQGLTKIEITYGTNGYPSGLGDLGIIGFENFEQAEDFVKENGGELAHFHKRDGWNLWDKKGTAYEPYTSSDYLNDLGDDYSFGDNSFSYWQDNIMTIVGNLHDGDGGIDDAYFDDLEAAVHNMKEIKLEVDAAEDDEDVIMNCGKYFETVKSKSMGYSHDTHTYAIGVLLSSK